jgi:hypothetical protein
MHFKQVNAMPLFLEIYLGINFILGCEDTKWIRLALDKVH